MRILILNDLHHKNNDFFINYQVNFLKGITSLLKKKDIDNIFILGDIMDNKFLLDINVMNTFRDIYSEMSKYVKQILVSCGNHDTYFNNKNNVNPLYTLFISENNKIIIDEAFKLENCVIVPWINESNTNIITDFVSKNNNENNYLFGHFELSGFKLNSVGSIISKHSQIFRTDYDKYKKVFSGHFHSKQDKNNVIYTGAPYQLNFGELDEKGIHILDTKTNEIEFIKNKKDIFRKIYIDDENDVDKLRGIKDKIVKVYVNINDIEFINNIDIEIEKNKPEKFELIVKEIEIEEKENDDKINNINEDLNNKFLESLIYDDEKEKKIISEIFNKTLKIVKEFGEDYE